MGKIAFVFAGQGAQHPGMGQELAEISPAAAEVFQKLDALRPGTSAQCPHLRLRGIMSIPPATATEEENKAFFQETYQLFIDMRNELGDNVSNIDCLSMGMSGDYPLAIAGGSTMVRVGTALFGARPPWHPQG